LLSWLLESLTTYQRSPYYSLIRFGYFYEAYAAEQEAGNNPF